MKIVFFASGTEQGKQLVSLVENEVPSYIYEIYKADGKQLGSPMELKIVSPGDKNFGELFFRLNFRSSDLIIFDASIEEEEGFELGKNYACATHAPYMPEHVLVVSRTVLPLNFIPHTTNVLPLGEDYVYVDGKMIVKRSYDNELDILPWIKNQIKDRYENGRLLLADYQLSTEDSVKKVPQLFISEKDTHIAFISYRSFYNKPNKCGKYSVQDLEKLILNYHRKNSPDEKWRVLFYPPGSLSQDCPTEDLRWALMSYIENVFKYIDEVWIFNSTMNDECSYWDSWFTQGEFFSLMSINQDLNHCMPKVFVFDPHCGTFEQKNEFPSNPSDISRELSALSINSDTLWGDRAAYKKLVYTIWHKNEFGFLKRISLKLGNALTRKFYGIEETLESLSKLHAYSQSFITHRVFSCKECMKTGHSMADFNNHEFLYDFVHIGDEKEPQRSKNIKNGVFSVSPDEFRAAVHLGYVECPNCHSKIYIAPAPDQDFYLWQRFIPNSPSSKEGYIEKISAYNIQ